MGVLIAIPTAGHLHEQTAGCLAALARQQIDFIIANGRPTDYNRNEICRKFLSTSHEHLLMIDADIGFDAEALPSLLALNLPLVSGLYPVIPNKLVWCCGTLDEAGHTHMYEMGQLPHETEPFTADFAGAGVLLIHRAGLENLDLPVFFGSWNRFWVPLRRIPLLKRWG